jgi:hypothetical protein
MITAVGQHPSPKVFEAAKDAIPPDRGDDHLDPVDFPPTLDPSLPASLVTAVGQHPFPKVHKAAKNTVPPDRGHGHLDLGSEGTENTNGTRGDHGCGLSGAQATAQKAVFNQVNYVDVDMAITFKIPIKSSSSPLPLSSARPLLPMPLVLTPPARTTNGARGDHGCGLSEAQPISQKVVFNQANHVDADMATAFKIPIKSSSSPLPLSSARPLCPCPLSSPHPPGLLLSHTT